MPRRRQQHHDTNNAGSTSADDDGLLVLSSLSALGDVIYSDDSDGEQANSKPARQRSSWFRRKQGKARAVPPDQPKSVAETVPIPESRPWPLPSSSGAGKGFDEEGMNEKQYLAQLRALQEEDEEREQACKSSLASNSSQADFKGTAMHAAEATRDAVAYTPLNAKAEEAKAISDKGKVKAKAADANDQMSVESNVEVDEEEDPFKDALAGAYFQLNRPPVLDAYSAPGQQRPAIGPSQPGRPRDDVDKLQRALEDENKRRPGALPRTREKDTPAQRGRYLGGGVWLG